MGKIDELKNTADLLYEQQSKFDNLYFEVNHMSIKHGDLE